MAELIFGLGQTRKKKETDAKIKFTKASQQYVTINETMELNARSSHHDRDQKYKAAKRETKKNLKHVSQEETGEMALRKQQNNREKRWKQTGRNQIKTNSKFDMARSLFGGGGPAPTSGSDEDATEEPSASYGEDTTEEPTASYDETQEFSDDDYYEVELTDCSEQFLMEGEEITVCSGESAWFLEEEIIEEEVEESRGTKKLNSTIEFHPMKHISHAKRCCK